MLQRISPATHRLVYGQLSALILSRAADANTVVDHGYNIFFSSSFCIVWPSTPPGPLAATIDPRVELMTKMTDPHGAPRLGNHARDGDRQRRGEQETKTKTKTRTPRGADVQSHTRHTLCPRFRRGSARSECFAMWRRATFMRRGLSFLFWVSEGGGWRVGGPPGEPLA